VQWCNTCTPEYLTLSQHVTSQAGQAVPHLHNLPHLHNSHHYKSHNKCIVLSPQQTETQPRIMSRAAVMPASQVLPVLCIKTLARQSYQTALCYCSHDAVLDREVRCWCRCCCCVVAVLARDVHHLHKHAECRCCDMMRTQSDSVMTGQRAMIGNLLWVFRLADSGQEKPGYLQLHHLKHTSVPLTLTTPHHTSVHTHTHTHTHTHNTRTQYVCMCDPSALIRNTHTRTHARTHTHTHTHTYTHTALT
jgi:hypothetical protein